MQTLYRLGYIQKSIATCPIPGKSYYRWLIRGPKEHLDINGTSLAECEEDVKVKLQKSMDRMNHLDIGPTARWEII